MIVLIFVFLFVVCVLVMVFAVIPDKARLSLLVLAFFIFVGAVLFFGADFHDYNVNEPRPLEVVRFGNEVKPECPYVTVQILEDGLPYFLLHDETGRGAPIKLNDIDFGTETKVVQNNFSNRFTFMSLGFGGKKTEYILEINPEDVF